MKIFNTPASQTGILLDIAALLFIVVVSLAHFVIRLENFVIIMYVFPIILVTWYSGLSRGIITSIAAGLGWYLIHYAPGVKPLPTASPMANMLGLWCAFLAFTVFIEKFRLRLIYQQSLCTLDDLTKTYNRTAFKDFTAKEIKRASRYKRSLTLIYLDVNEFEKITESRGYEAGNEMLVSMVNVIKTSIRESDYISRLGVDEFGILLPETDNNQVNVVINKIKAKLTEMTEQNGWPITFGFNIVTCTGAGTTAEALINKTTHISVQA